MKEKTQFLGTSTMSINTTARYPSYMDPAPPYTILVKYMIIILSHHGDVLNAEELTLTLR